MSIFGNNDISYNVIADNNSDLIEIQDLRGKRACLNTASVSVFGKFDDI